MSFETIEHVPDPELFLNECERVLVPGGLLVISTPNRDVYHQIMSGHLNPFHCSEMSLPEFEAILRPRFRKWSIYTQCPQRPKWYHVEAWFSLAVVGISLPLLARPKCEFLGHIFRDPTAEERQQPEEIILCREPFLAELFNPLCSTANGWFSAADPTYWVGVVHAK